MIYRDSYLATYKCACMPSYAQSLQDLAGPIPDEAIAEIADEQGEEGEQGEDPQEAEKMMTDEMNEMALKELDAERELMEHAAEMAGEDCEIYVLGESDDEIDAIQLPQGCGKLERSNLSIFVLHGNLWTTKGFVNCLSTSLDALYHTTPLRRLGRGTTPMFTLACRSPGVDGQSAARRSPFWEPWEEFCLHMWTAARVTRCGVRSWIKSEQQKPKALNEDPGEICHVLSTCRLNPLHVAVYCIYACLICEAADDIETWLFVQFIKCWLQELIWISCFCMYMNMYLRI